MKEVALTEARKRLLEKADLDESVFEEVVQGNANVYELVSAPILTLIRGEGREMVVVGVVGQKLRDGVLELLRFGRLSGFATARFHTERPDVILRALGHVPSTLVEHRRKWFKPDEFVYRVKL